MSEFIVTLMLNIIADYFALWVITNPLKDAAAYSPMTPPIATAGCPFALKHTIIWMVVTVALMWFVFRPVPALAMSGAWAGRIRSLPQLGGCRSTATLWW